MLAPCLSPCSNHRLRIRARLSTSKPSSPPSLGCLRSQSHLSPLTPRPSRSASDTNLNPPPPPVLQAIECVTNYHRHSAIAAVVAVVAAVHTLPPLRACMLSSLGSPTIRASFLPITCTLPTDRPMSRHVETALHKLMPMWPRLLQKRRRQRQPRNRRQCVFRATACSRSSGPPIPNLWAILE